MTDDRLHRWLEAATEPLAPDAVFAAELRETLRDELGFEPVGNVLRLPRGRGKAVRPLHRRPELLLVAALLIGGGVGLGILLGGGTDLLRGRHALLDQVQISGQLRIAVRPDQPQVTVSGEDPVGFDVDVARELAARLGVKPEIVVVQAPMMLSGQADEQWDIALPSVAAWQIDTSRFRLSSSYYRWRHRLVVPDSSTADNVGDLSATPICAVTGDGGESWLRGDYGGVASSPRTSLIVVRQSDDECFAALAAGDVGAIVTAQTSDADLQVRSGIKVIEGPDPEPRAAIVRIGGVFGSDASTLLAAIDDAIASMRADGTLAQLSQTRFGGTDLVAP
jgi:cystine transport system substrate-binding protein